MALWRYINIVCLIETAVHFCPLTPLILVGTKVDLMYDEEATKLVLQKESIEFAKHLKIPFVECSALSGYNISKLLEILANPTLNEPKISWKQKFAILFKR